MKAGNSLPGDRNFSLANPSKYRFVRLPAEVARIDEGASKPLAMLELSDIRGDEDPQPRTKFPTTILTAESQKIKTLKYRPEFPKRFGSIQHARDVCRDLFEAGDTKSLPERWKKPLKSASSLLTTLSIVNDYMKTRVGEVIVDKGSPATCILDLSWSEQEYRSVHFVSQSEVAANRPKYPQRRGSSRRRREPTTHSGLEVSD